MEPTTPSDAELVAATVAGRRDAFRQIVERYQTLICSIAYNATGSVNRSEDVAQETFIAAWDRLATLREPEKLRGWLCGIVRNRLGRERRDEQREPVHGADPLDSAHDAPAPETLPSDRAVQREEEAILWRALEKIPELYREPLILFYREHQSIEHVARSLELTEDAVKQRLARGRKLLEAEVQSFVEKTLQRTAPGRTFSASVLATLPLAGGATAGVGVAAKSALATKSGALSIMLAPLAPFLGIAAGAAAQGMIIREFTADPALRFRRIAQMVTGWILYIGAAAGGEAIVRALADRFAWDQRLRFEAVVGYWALFVAGTITVQMLVLRRWLTRRRERESHPAPAMVATAVTPMKPRTLALAIVGMQLAMFSWLAALAWRADDAPGLAGIAATFVALCLGSFLVLRRDTRGPLAAVAGVGRHATWGAGLILIIINVRADVWIAAGYGVTVHEAQRLVPLWLVPALTAGLVLWTLLLFALMRPWRAGDHALDRFSAL